MPNLRILTPGLDPDRADALLQTKGPRKLIDDLLATASYVVIEAPPTSDSPDAQTLAGVADLAVLVVEAGQSSAREVIDAVAQVESMHAAVLGAVVARYGRDSDADQRRRGAAAALPADEDDEDDEVEPTEETEETEDEPTVAADDEVVEEAVPVEESVRAEAPVRTVTPLRAGATAASAVPAVEDLDDEDPDDEDEDETTVLPTGGRPQLVPPGSAGPAKR